MPDQTEEGDPTTADNQAEPKVRFVTARPDSTQARREVKSLIRAHASRASWAKIRKGKHSKQEGGSQIGSSQRLGVQQNRLGNTELVSHSNDEQGKDITSLGVAGPSGSRQVVPSRRLGITGSFPVPNPLRTLGAGDIDPFSSYPSRLPKMIATPIIAQVNLFFNTMFLPDPDRREESTTIRHWISWYLKNSILFHALCYSQLARLSVTEASGLTHISQRAKWYCYSMVVGEINRRFNNVSTRCSDESILAVMALAYHGDRTAAHDSEPSIRSPSQGPLNSMQGLDLYAGRLDPVHMHVHGLAQMLAMRGGVDEIQSPGLAAMLSYGELILASRSLQKPASRFVPIGESPGSTLATVQRAGHPLAQLGTGFQMLHDVLPSEMAQEIYVVLLHLSTYLLAVEDYIMGRPQAQSVLTLADQRNFVQHSLLSTFTSAKDDTTAADEMMYSLQQATWCAGVVYSLISVFPIPHAGALFAQLASQIKQRLISTTSSGGGSHDGNKWQEAASLMLWITFMGALASTADPRSKAEKTWYISVLERLVHRMQILSWQGLRNQLLNFLWLPSTSDTDGQRLWREIHTSNPFR